MADNTMSLFVWPSFCLHFSSSTIYLLSCSLCIAVLSDGCSGAMGVLIFRRYCPQYCVQVAGKKKRNKGGTDSHLNFCTHPIQILRSRIVKVSYKKCWRMHPFFPLTAIFKVHIRVTSHIYLMAVAVVNISCRQFGRQSKKSVCDVDLKELVDGRYLVSVTSNNSFSMSA